jgi:phosphoribosylglycinamide formyltransferase-1
VTRVAILISGGGSNMVKLVESMKGDHPARPCLVFSNKADSAGLVKAQGFGVPTAHVDHRPFGEDRAAFEAELNAHLEASKADLLCFAGFMRIFTTGFMEKWRGRAINIHPSLLPKYKGLNTHTRALEAGDAETGCSVHEVTPALDDGPLLGQARVPIVEGDTPESLAARVLAKEHILYPAVLRRYVVGTKTPLFLD